MSARLLREDLYAGHRSGHSRRRAGDAAVADVAFGAAQAVPAADRRRALASSRPCAASADAGPLRRAGRSSPMPITASSSPSRRRNSASTPAAVLLEPVARNTAAAIAAAAVFVAERFGRDARHPRARLRPCRRRRRQLLAGASSAAAAAARAGRLVTFGITPTAPETGYGYIEAGAELGDGVHAVARFVEKPDRATRRGDARAGRLLLELRHVHARRRQLPRRSRARSRPRRSRAAEAAVAAGQGRSRFHPPRRSRASPRPPTSRSTTPSSRRRRHVALVPVTYAWSDLGAWDAVWKVSAKDARRQRRATAMPRSPTPATRWSSRDRAHVAVEGLDDIAVIATEDAIYVGKLSEAQKVGPMVKALQGQRRDRRRSPKSTAPPTGPGAAIRSVLNGERFQVKRLVRQAGQEAEPAEAPPPRRALGRRARHRRGHGRRQGDHAAPRTSRSTCRSAASTASPTPARSCSS